jgi:hypothetical protein
MWRERRLRFAAAVRSLADRHWVQTPYRYFPDSRMLVERVAGLPKSLIAVRTGE